MSARGLSVSEAVCKVGVCAGCNGGSKWYGGWLNMARKGSQRYMKQDLYFAKLLRRVA